MSSDSSEDTGSDSNKSIVDSSSNPSETQLKVKNLPYKTSVEDVKEMFGQFGEITKAILEYNFDDQQLICYLNFKDDSIYDKVVTQYSNNNDDSTIVEKICYGNGLNIDDRKRKKAKNDWAMDSSESNRNSGSSRGRGRSGGRGGDRGGYRGGSRSCYNCGKEGHISRECTKERNENSRSRGGRGGGGGGGRGGPRTCYNCGEEGHISRECSNKDAGGRSNRGKYDSRSKGFGGDSNNKKSAEDGVW